MEIRVQEYRILLELCGSVLQGKIDLVSFYDKWPYGDKTEDAFLQHLFEDLEDGIQHTPGSLFTGKVLVKEWTNLEFYWLIMLDKILLEKCPQTQTMLSCRESILEISQQLHKMNIEKDVESCLHRAQGGHSGG